MRFHFVLLSLIAIPVFSAMSALAGVIYTNGPINGGVNAWNVCCGYQVSDSFTVSSATTITSFDAGFWLNPGDTPVQVDWSIGSTFFGNDVASGTAIFSNTLYCSACGLGVYDIYTSTANGLNVAVSPGTYFLTLENAVTAFGSDMYWDENDGSSLAMENPFFGSIGSEAFTIYNAQASIPEPGTLIMVGSGVLGLTVVMRRKIRF